MKKSVLFLLALGLIATFTFCGKDNDDTKPDPMGRYHKLYGKWWYNDPAQHRGDHLFTATDSMMGAMEWKHVNQMVNHATYQWFPTGDSMLITIPQYDPLAFYFEYITDDSMGYRPGNELHNLYRFYTTKP
jgi:hypothetical protein